MYYCVCVAMPSRVGYQFGMAILSIVIIILSVALALIVTRRCLRSRRQRKLANTQSQTVSSSGINFSALEEEPEVDFYGDGSRKLQIM